MKARILVLTGALLLLAAFPALAGTNKFSKSLKGGGTVSFKVKTNKKGTATKVTSIKVKDLPTKCTDADTNVTAGPTLSVSLGSTKVRVQNLGGGKTYGFNLNKFVANRGWTFNGAFSSRKGRKVSEGQVAITFEQGGGSCGASVQFKAKRK